MKLLLGFILGLVAISAVAQSPILRGPLTTNTPSASTNMVRNIISGSAINGSGFTNVVHPFLFDKPTIVIADGNSRMVGTVAFASPLYWLTNNYATSNIVYVTNFSVSGNTVEQRFAAYPTNAQPLIAAAGTTNVVFLFLDHIVNITSAQGFNQVKTNLANYFTALKTNANLTMVSFTAAEDSQPSVTITAQQVLLDSNTWIRTNGISDLTVDVANLFHSPGFTIDELHFTTNTARIIARATADTLKYRQQPVNMATDWSGPLNVRGLLTSTVGSVLPNVQRGLVTQFKLASDYPSILFDATGSGVAGGGAWLAYFSGEFSLYGTTNIGNVGNSLAGWNSARSWVSAKFGAGTNNPREALEVVGNTYVSGDVSALSFTDRSQSPDDKAEAWEIVKSHQARNGRVDHSVLSTNAWGTDRSERNLSMVVSAQSMALQDLNNQLSIIYGLLAGAGLLGGGLAVRSLTKK